MTTTTSAGAPAQPTVVVTAQDLVFYCPHCEGELVVDREGAGLDVNCPHCQKVITIPDGKSSAAAPDDAPPPAVPPAAAAAPVALPQFDFSGYSPEQVAQRTSELHHQLKENQSQDMEMRGHINRATIELHRLQLKLKKLQDRKSAIAAELVALRDAATPQID